MRATIASSTVAVLALAAQVSAQAPANATAVSADTFKAIQQHTAYAAASYSDTCASPPYQSTRIATIANDAAGTYASIFKNPYSREILLAFRGTFSPQGFQTDLQFGLTPLQLAGTSCSDCQVHGGFQAAYLAIQTQVLSAVRSAIAANPGYSFLVVGHSLGGGLAALATSHLTANSVKISRVYTYGEPRNGNPAWAAYINSQFAPANYFRVTHSNDGVPHIPPAFFGFSHHGTEYWESSNGTNSAATTFMCPGVDPTNCNAATDYGDNAIDGAHISYSNMLIGNVLRVTQCGEGQVY